MALSKQAADLVADLRLWRRRFCNPGPGDDRFPWIKGILHTLNALDAELARLEGVCGTPEGGQEPRKGSGIGEG